MKKLAKIVLLSIISAIIVMAISSCASIDNSSANSSVKGTGTKTDPYHIENITQLEDFRKQTKTENYKNMYFVLDDDIDCGGMQLTTVVSFNGNFNGNNHTIKNFSVGSKNYQSIGFFGSVEGIIENLKLDDFKVISTFAEAEYSNCTGGIAGWNNGTIKNCYVNGEIEAGGAYGSRVGGIVGYNNGTISSCFSDGSVYGVSSNNGKDYFPATGGLVGMNVGTVEKSGTDCDSVKCSSVSYGSSGGLVGINTGTISESYATAGVQNDTGDYLFAGGFVGRNQGKIKNCYAQSAVVCNMNVVFSHAFQGGFVGRNNDTIENCYAASITTATTKAYDLYCISQFCAENMNGATIRNSYATGYIDLQYITGWDEGTPNVTNCFIYSNEGSNSDCYIISADKNRPGESECTYDELSSIEFYQNVLHWPDSIWNYNNLDTENSVYPILKNVKRI